MRRRHAIWPASSVLHQDLGISSLKGHDSACDRILSVGAWDLRWYQAINHILSVGAWGISGDGRLDGAPSAPYDERPGLPHHGRGRACCAVPLMT